MRNLADGQEGGKAGIYLDLPLGVHPHSYDVWRERNDFVLEVSAGAPPDTLFTKGQNWGFPPLHPEAIRQNGYAYLIESLRHQFRYARWVRMDHVMSLHRLFWITAGREATEGVYVRYRPEELYAIVSLESHRSRTVVVGETLGTVPSAVTQAMNRRGLKPMYVLQYEAQPDARKCLRAVPPNAVVSLNTHDMPPFAAFWKGSDLRDLDELGVFESEELGGLTKNRRLVRRALEQFLGGKPGTGAPKSGPGKLFERCLAWLARSEAKMVLVNLEDLWGETESQNVPGTHLERPNWQRKARYSLEEFSAHAGFASLLQMVARRRAQPARKKPLKRKRISRSIA